MPDHNQLYANGFNLMPEMGPVRLNKLLNYFGNFSDAWQKGSHTDYLAAGLEEKLVKQIIARKLIIKPEQRFGQLEKHNIQILLSTDAQYPPQLKEILSSPPLIYVRGNPQALTRLSMAVVGTRNMSLYGKQACQEIVSQLAQNGVGIVSGLAFGIDTEALKTCVECGGFPVAVLASAIDDASISPRTNLQLAQQIMNAGCLVSEFPLGNSVQKQNFPIRNRIISGLSVGTLVVEADLKSGSLITAEYALEQNREVFAVPGSIFSIASRGTNDLIKKGAKLVAHSNDIMEELNLRAVTEEPAPMSDNEIEQVVLSLLSKNPVHIDHLIKNSKLATTQTNSTLSILEIKGRIKNLGGGNYIKIR